jgi:uncharacterized membrane protein YuzA (DUF378 family)
MVSALKRLIFIIGFIPVSIIGGLKWVIVGGNSFDLLDKFDKWTNNDPGF